VDINRMVDEWKTELDPARPEYEEMLKALEQLRDMKTETELWIGKDDYLIRQIKQDMHVPLQGTSSAMWKFYDFNEPIERSSIVAAYALAITLCGLTPQGCIIIRATRITTAAPAAKAGRSHFQKMLFAVSNALIFIIVASAKSGGTGESLREARYCLASL
ncbi:unnamed protein product, partial [marine sediment metagenome]